MRKSMALVLAVVLFTTTGAAELLVSTPNTVAAGDAFSVTVESTRNSTYDVEVNVEGVSASASLQDVTGAESFTLTAPSTGEYTVTATATYPNGDTESAESIISVTGFSSVEPVILTASPADSCGFSSLDGDCRLAAINLSSTSSSPLASSSDLPVRGGSASIGGRMMYIRATGSGSYTALHIDDDTSFQESNETGAPERTIRNGQEAFPREGLTLTALTADRALFHVPPGPGERPLRDGDSLVTAFLARDTSGVAQGIQVPVTIRSLDGAVLESDTLMTGTHGLTRAINVTGLSPGRYAINAANSSRSIVGVRSFDISYTITDSTGSRTRTVEPGSNLTIDPAPVINGSRVTPDSRSITVVLPGGTTLTPSGTAVHIPSDAKAGTATVTMSVTYDGRTRTASTSLELRTFKVMTIPLRETEYGLSTAHGFAPGSEGHLFIGAVRVGTAGSIQELQQATFYPLENTSTAANECTQNVGNITGRMNGDPITIRTNATSLGNSSLVDPDTEFPDGFMTQCIASFTVPDATGTITGTIAATREATGTTEEDSLLITSRRFDAEGAAVRPSTGERQWRFGTGDRIGIRPTIYSLDTNDQINRSRITDMSLLTLRGPGSANATFRNASAQNGPMLVIEPVGESGSYRAEFRATINRSDGSTGFATGTAYFSARSLVVDVDRSGGWGPVAPSTTMVLDVHARTPYGSDRSGVSVAVTSIYNTRTDEELIGQASTTTNVTNANGKASLTIDPDGQLPDGQYRIAVNATGPNASVESTLYQEIDEYQADLRRQDYGQVVSGDVLNITGQLRRTGTGAPVSFSIDRSGTRLVYLGKRGTISRETIDVGDNLTIIQDRIRLETGGLDAGMYRLEAELMTSSGTEMAEAYFRVQPFAATIREHGQRQAYGPGGTVPLNVSVGSVQPFTVSIESLESFEQQYNVSRQEDEQYTFTGRSWGLFNITVPAEAEDGYHHADLEINTSDGTIQEFVSFEVQPFIASTPKSIEFQPSTTLFSNETSLTNAQYEDKLYLFSDQWTTGTCSTELSEQGLNVSGSFGNQSCAVSEYRWPFGRLTEDTVRLVAVNNTKLWATQDGTLNNTDDLAQGIMAGQQLVTPHGNSFILTQLNVSGSTKLVDQGFNRSCGDLVSRYGLSLSGGSFGDGHTCRLAYNRSLLGNGATETYNVLYDNATDTTWASLDSTLNESGDLAAGIGSGTTVTTDNGYDLRFARDQDSYSLQIKLTVVNGFVNGIMTPPSADRITGQNSFYSGPEVKTVQESGGLIGDGNDFNGDGDRNDTLYVVANVTGTSVSEVWASMDRDFTSGDRLELSGPKTSASVEGAAVYRGSSRPNNVGKDSIMLYLPFDGGWYSQPTKRPRTNLTVPLLVRRPKGTAIDGATVGIFELRREIGQDTESRDIGTTWTTDSNGMTFITVNLTMPDPDESDIGEYTVIPTITPPGSTDASPMDVWDSPGAQARLYDVRTDTYQGVSLGLNTMSNTTSTQFENSTRFTDAPTSDEYRYTTVNESSHDCLDLDDSGNCDTAHLVLYNGSGQIAGIDVDTGAIHGDRDLNDYDHQGVDVFNMTQPVGDSFTSVYAGTTLSMPSDYVRFDEATDTAHLHQDTYEPRTERNITLGVQVTGLYSDSDGKVVNVSIKDEDGNVIRTVATNDRYGTAFIEIAPHEVTETPAWVLQTDEAAEEITLDGTAHTFEAVSVDSASSATIEVDSQQLSVSEGETFTVDGEPVTVDELIYFGGSGGSVELTHDVWPSDEYIQIQGNISTSGGTKQTFEEYIGFE